jgi:acid phosphatase
VLRAALAIALLAATPALAAEPVAPATPGQIVGYHDSGEWASDTAHAIGRARTALLGHLSGVSHPALVLDIDDTALSTYDCLKAVDFDRSVPTTCAKDATLPAIVPTRSLYRAARRHGVTVFFVTGRHPAMRGPTLRNLRRQGYTGTLHVVLRTGGGSNAAFKTRARRGLERRGYRILMDVGDQRSDLSGGHARRTVKLPNPMYVTR